MAVTKLEVVWEKRYLCPKCGKKLHYVEGDAVSVVNGRVDMNSTLPRYVLLHAVWRWNVAPKKR